MYILRASTRPQQTRGIGRGGRQVLDEMWRLRCVAVRSASQPRPAPRLGLGTPHKHTIARLDARESAASFHGPEWRTFSTGSRGSYGRGVCRPDSDAAHRNKRIAAADDCESILAIVVAEHGECNARNAATACHRLAKLSQGNRNGPRMADPRAGLLLSVATKVSASITRRRWRTRQLCDQSSTMCKRRARRRSW